MPTRATRSSDDDDSYVSPSLMEKILHDKPKELYEL